MSDFVDYYAPTLAPRQAAAATVEVPASKLSDFRTTARQLFPDAVYAALAFQANAAYVSKTYNVPDLHRWIEGFVGHPVTEDHIRTSISLCQRRGLLMKPKRPPKSKSKYVPKVAKPPKEKVAAPVAQPVQPFDPGMTADGLVEVVCSVLYADSSHIPAKHLGPMLRFHQHVQHFLDALR